jgi:hypothetical protein
MTNAVAPVSKLSPNERFAISQFLCYGWEEATAGMDFGEIMEAVRGEDDGGPTIDGLNVWDPFSGTPVYATECIENLLSSLEAHMAPMLRFVQEAADLPKEGEFYTPLINDDKLGTIDGPEREKEWGNDAAFEKLHELIGDAREVLGQSRNRDEDDEPTEGMAP